MKTSFFDIVDENNTPLHKTAGYEEVQRLGLWHRGVHIIIYTPEHEVLMQKRSSSLAYRPGEVEISAGGGVEANESSEQAIIRETHEEFGLTIQPNQLRFIGTSKFNEQLGRRYNRVIVYSYAVCLPKSTIHYSINPAETSLAFFIQERQLRRALRHHRIKNIGRISGLYAYWRQLLDAM